MIFEPHPTRSGPIFLGVGLTTGALAVFLLTLLLPAPADPIQTFQLFLGLLTALIITGLALYGAVIAYKLTYHLNRNGLVIQWGLISRLIPFEKITDIIPAHTMADALTLTSRNIAGLQTGRGTLTGYGPVKIYATAPLAASLLVITPNQSYLISPRFPDQFIKAWQNRRRLGQTQTWAETTTRHWPLNSPMLTDRLTWGLLLPAAIIFMAMFGFLALNYARIPTSLPIHFNALGRPDRIADKSALFNLLKTGGIILGLNALLGGLLYRREKMAAYLLWSSAGLAELFLGIALLTIN